MRLIRLSELVRQLGISRRTVSGWCVNDPTLAVKRGRQWWIKIDELAKRPGLDIVSARTLTLARWIKAVDLATLSNMPRRTLANWCRTRKHLAKRIGRVWYIDANSLGATGDQLGILSKLILDLK